MIVRILALLLVLGGVVWADTAKSPNAGKKETLERVVAVVNDSIILQSELDARLVPVRAEAAQIIVMDSDLTHDPAEIPRLLHVGQIYDIVSGSRFCAGGRMVDTTHYVISMLFNWSLRLLLRTQVQDNLGGYFTARREMILQLPPNEIFYGYGEYYFRLLYFAQKAGHSIVEIPSAYLLRGTGTSKSNWLKMFWSYSLAAVRLRLSVPRRDR